jgi:chemotaxis response regulator CheB
VIRRDGDEGMKAIVERGGAKPVASNKNTSTAVRMSQEAIKLDSAGAILDADYVCRSIED